MTFRTVASPVLTILSAVSVSTKADEKATPAAQRFEALKQLAGDRVEVGKDGEPTDKVVSSIRWNEKGA